jgi:hypothetical protein
MPGRMSPFTLAKEQEDLSTMRALRRLGLSASSPLVPMPF